MSTQPPQVLSRKANGPSSSATSQPSDQIKVRQRVRASQAKDNDTGGNALKPAKGKGPADRRGGASNKSANDGEVAPKAARSKPQNEGEKLVIRRLPPGMTMEEFISILGPEWEMSKGKVDWFSYVPGKISIDPSKPSRPGRAYVHLVRKDDIMPLSEVVRNATWEDAKSTFTNPSLIGPPVLEFSIYKKVPGTKKRTDTRQGTIDQDPEFMAFLEGLANPAPMRESIDVEDADESAKVEVKVTTTPLVEFLKEKKANRGKDGSGKNSKSGKGKSGAKDDDSFGRKKGKESRTEKQDKTPKENVKILTKKAATEQAAEGAKKVASQIATANAAATTAAAATDAPKSRRAGIAAAARILQRDLGLSPGSAHRRARHDAAKAEADAKAASSSTKDDNGTTADVANAASSTASAASPAEVIVQAPKSRPDSPVAPKPQAGRRNRGGKGGAEKGKSAANETSGPQPTAANPPVILRKKNDSETNKKTAEPQVQASGPVTNSNGNGRQAGKEKANSKLASQKKSPAVSANATRAFIKHVNASQGVNDAKLREALGAFGTITLVEIDKRKGFAYVDFSEHEALVKAVAASPVQVGQGNVQVAERKDKKLTAAAAAPGGSAKDGQTPNGEKEKEKASGGRGRRGRGGGGGKAAAGTANGQATAGPALASTGG
ncbi:Smg-4/UPF3 family protein [Metarhizium robertsii]|uniref:RNA recognition motif domain protein n=2 Tax=Metarhizium robertsii TaxID=568076 RepID=E9ENT0_METRA|nr:RNA recognition motif domain protein [Metarhizium robertsii ARSEF 23]EFZ02200.1 RNA recognition motif domain protein [Metarhizium robertsii ARSEF 23]EXV05371.1 Smg-4/UPF3 family protein [Metarhizium robertsii]